jgi:hypothetical protein
MGQSFAQFVLVIVFGSACVPKTTAFYPLASVVGEGAPRLLVEIKFGTKSHKTNCDNKMNADNAQGNLFADKQVQHRRKTLWLLTWGGTTIL